MKKHIHKTMIKLLRLIQSLFYSKERMKWLRYKDCGKSIILKEKHK